jgi:hypothetical protein
MTVANKTIHLLAAAIQPTDWFPTRCGIRDTTQSGDVVTKARTLVTCPGCIQVDERQRKSYKARKERRQKK